MHTYMALQEEYRAPTNYNFIANFLLGVLLHLFICYAYKMLLKAILKESSITKQVILIDFLTIQSVRLSNCVDLTR